MEKLNISAEDFSPIVGPQCDHFELENTQEGNEIQKLNVKSKKASKKKTSVKSSTNDSNVTNSKNGISNSNFPIKKKRRKRRRICMPSNKTKGRSDISSNAPKTKTRSRLQGKVLKSTQVAPPKVAVDIKSNGELTFHKEPTHTYALRSKTKGTSNSDGSHSKNTERFQVTDSMKHVEKKTRIPGRKSCKKLTGRRSPSPPLISCLRSTQSNAVKDNKPSIEINNTRELEHEDREEIEVSSIGIMCYQGVVYSASYL